MSAGASNVSSSRSKTPSFATSTGPPHARYAIASSAHSRAIADEKVLLIISKTSKAGDPDPLASPNDRLFSGAVSGFIPIMF